jgi:hypothetical protein
VVATGVFVGFANIIPVNNTLTWAFMGPTALVSTTAVQRLTGTAEVPIGAAASTTVHIDLCYQPNGGGALVNFSGGAYSIHQVTTTRAEFSAVGSVVPGAGNWNVGMCTRQNTSQINNNDYVNGWVQVTN